MYVIICSFTHNIKCVCVTYIDNITINKMSSVKTSYGVILFDIITNNNTLIQNVKKEFISYIGRNGLTLNNDDELFNGLSKLELFSSGASYNKYHNLVTFLMVKRKHTYSYIQFVKGNYNLSCPGKIIELIQLMTYSEHQKIKDCVNFKELWDDVCCNYTTSIDKNAELAFSNIRNGIRGNIKLNDYLSAIPIPFHTSDWGFPKGKKNSSETSYDAAVRETYEEIGVSIDSYRLMDNETCKEDLIGTDKNNYSYTYHVGMPKKQLSFVKDKYEIGGISWLPYIVAINNIRIYNYSRISILTDLFNKIISILTKIDNCLRIKHKKKTSTKLIKMNTTNV